ALAEPAQHRRRSISRAAGNRKPRVNAGVGSDADEEAVAEVALELALEDLHRGGFDVVLNPLEVELALLGVVDRVARAVVVVARLPDRADAHDVLPAVAQRELAGRQLLDLTRA